MSDLSGKCAIVTGGARGIGSAIVLKLAGLGADVAIVDLLEAEAEDTVRKVEALGRKSVAVRCDISSSEDVKEMFETVKTALGGVHILINNAGITRDNLMLRMSDSDWDSVIKVNLTGTFNCCRVAAKHFIRQRSGRIVNLASVVGIMGNAGQVNYSSSKAGIIGLTKSVAKELAPRGVTVNAIAPGYIETEMTGKLPEEARSVFMSAIPLGRFGTVDDVANIVAFLVSDDANYITGQVIKVDGGMLM
ncbi:3-oxoacyl-[acyl-carrier-protein] reductase [Candidatus Eisenbacteria bacterium]|uniref:3-oxoacyl-[acyl-carrier-protein] reductase n=1 Tax=Eiseniibacteriota bacterium TaxID=2212470 RepID=A0ABV6YP83_UNCEI